jgi:hypothetical protein
LVPERFTLGQLGKAYATLLRLGFEFITDIKECLEQRFRTGMEVAECIRALKSLAKARAVPIYAHCEWRSLVEIRFDEQSVQGHCVGIRNLGRIHACGEAMDELEDLIRVSNRWGDWETDPEPIVEMIKEEATEIGEVWAPDLAVRMRLWLQPHPQKALIGALRDHQGIRH